MAASLAHQNWVQSIQMQCNRAGTAAEIESFPAFTASCKTGLPCVSTTFADFTVRGETRIRSAACDVEGCKLAPFSGGGEVVARAQLPPARVAPALDDAGVDFWRSRSRLVRHPRIPRSRVQC